MGGKTPQKTGHCETDRNNDSLNHNNNSYLPLMRKLNVLICQLTSLVDQSVSLYTLHTGLSQQLLMILGRMKVQSVLPGINTTRRLQYKTLAVEALHHNGSIQSHSFSISLLCTLNKKSKWTYVERKKNCFLLMANTKIFCSILGLQ